jgi:hypothetical protein
MKKTSFFCRAGFSPERALSKSAVQPFDLMSRRHPLFVDQSRWLDSLREANRSDGSCDVAGVNPPAMFKASYFFFLETFFAVFFTALFAAFFAFFAFLAFLAMLPS